MSVQNTTEVHERVSEAEETLTEKAASQKADELYLGEPDEGTIVDVNPDPEDDGSVVEFTISLPNEKKATMSFSEHEFERGRCEEFLDNINCTVSDMTEAMYHDIPVVYTDWKGWIVPYGKSKHLDTTYAGESSWYDIAPDTGHPHPNTKYSQLLSSPLYVGVGLSLFNWSVAPVIFGFFIMAFIWYCNCAMVGMSMPHRKPLSIIKDGDK